MQSIDQLSSFACFILPVAIASMDKDKDREYMTELYLRFKPLMYRVAKDFFPNDPDEQDDAVSAAVVNMCAYVRTIRSLPEERVPSYLVQVVRSACNGQLRKLYRQNQRIPPAFSLEEIGDVEDTSSPHDKVLSEITAMEMLNSFQRLSRKERELIRLRHIDRMEYEDIAQVLGITPATARTALYRAKKRLESLIPREHQEEQP